MSQCEWCKKDGGLIMCDKCGDKCCRECCFGIGIGDARSAKYKNLCDVCWYDTREKRREVEIPDWYWKCDACGNNNSVWMFNVFGTLGHDDASIERICSECGKMYLISMSISVKAAEDKKDKGDSV